MSAGHNRPRCRHEIWIKIGTTFVAGLTVVRYRCHSCNQTYTQVW